MLAILRTHHLQLPNEVSIIAKMMVMMESLGMRLNPEFNLGVVMKPRRKSSHCGG
ncbi:hypothetical protein NHF46_08055 [Arthrobacter alpinus]|nr:hypothetical protein [Arthrobacter alpinus]